MDRRKMKNFLIGMMLVCASLLLVASCGATVSAESLNESVSIGGHYVVAPVMIIVGAFLFIMGLFMKEKPQMIAFVLAILLVIVGVVMFVDLGDASTGQVSGDVAPGFSYTASPVTSGTDFITDTSWDADTKTWTIPIDITDATNGTLNGHKAALNFTFDSDSEYGVLGTIVNPIFYRSDYAMQYNGKDILAKSGNVFQAIWSSAKGTEDYSGSQDCQLSGTVYAQITYTFNNNSAGNWLSGFDSSFDSTSWQVRVHNEGYPSDDSWFDYITVKVIVDDYTE